MKYYVKIKHPITGDTIQVVPTGKKKTEERTGETVLEAVCITPKTKIGKLWIKRNDLVE